MTSQLLFGETYSIIGQRSNWIKIRCSYDSYTGWIDFATAYQIPENIFISIREMQPVILDKKMICIIPENQFCMTIVPGSNLPFYHADKQTLIIQELTFMFKEKPVTGPEVASGESVISTAKAFLNAPYLWGGRSLFGIDCSGLTQVVFKINSVKIPRDTGRQVLSGKPVDKFEDARQGDLAFFGNKEGNISHVGILMAKNQILHASGHVRIDRLDAKGIFNADKQCYTHRFECIRRLL
jgi:hypothetical protein